MAIIFRNSHIFSDKEAVSLVGYRNSVKCTSCMFSLDRVSFQFDRKKVIAKFNKSEFLKNNLMYNKIIMTGLTDVFK